MLAFYTLLGIIMRVYVLAGLLEKVVRDVQDYKIWNGSFNSIAEKLKAKFILYLERACKTGFRDKMVTKNLK